MNVLLKKFIEFAFGNGIVLILGFLSSPIITRLILPEEYGKFSMFSTITNLLLIAMLLGFDQAYVRFYYEEDSDGKKKLLRESIKIPLMISMFISIILLIFHKSISRFLIGESSIIIIIAIIIQIQFSILGRFALLLIRMQQRGKLYSTLQVITKVLYITFVLMIFKIVKNDYKTLVFATILSNIVVVVISILAEKKEWFFKCDNIKMNTTNKQMIKFGIPLVFSMIITWVFQSIDRVAINLFSNFNELGIYSSAFSIVALLNAFQDAFTTFWVPVANEKYKENSKNTEFFRKIFSLVSLFMLLIAILLITFKDVLILLLGSKYREASFIFPFLVFMPLMYTISETTVVGINFKKRTKNHILIAVVSAICNILGNCILVPPYGAKGAAISTGISYIIFFILRTKISGKLYEVGYNIKKLYISLVPLTILALYASFNTFDIKLIAIGSIALLTVIVMYGNEINDIFQYIVKLFSRKKSDK
ncbi:oligosaccharide flippase family protein [Clostridium sp. LP20]|uniref:oligosaccharide flippase family protein n=1 Tax=Clostridium sp. LP20 TaxID=3418665 RepID=UPI003EE58D1F